MAFEVALAVALIITRLCECDFVLAVQSVAQRISN
jgi:hypothetical protein